MTQLDFINIEQPFAFNCNTQEFTDAELAKLDKYGYWLTALALGVIKPESKEQQQFVNFTLDLARPGNDFEEMWAKLMKLRKTRNPRYALSTTDLPKSKRKYIDSTPNQTIGEQELKSLMNKLRGALETGRSKTEIAFSIYSQWESGKELSQKQIQIVGDIVSKSKPKGPKMITGNSRKDGSHRSNW